VAQDVPPLRSTPASRPDLRARFARIKQRAIQNAEREYQDLMRRLADAARNEKSTSWRKQISLGGSRSRRAPS
jgi:hypothetical protein